MAPCRRHGRPAADIACGKNPDENDRDADSEDLRYPISKLFLASFLRPMTTATLQAGGPLPPTCGVVVETTTSEFLPTYDIQGQATKALATKSIFRGSGPALRAFRKQKGVESLA